MDSIARSPDRVRRDMAFRATLVFLVAGVAWVVLSDLFLFEVVHDRAVLTRLETGKGCAFVAASALGVFTLVHRAVARLQRAQGTNQAILGSIADGILMVGRDGRVIDANPAALKMLELKNVSQVVGMGTEEFSRAFRLSYLDGRLVPPQSYMVLRALRGEPVAPYRAAFHLPSGRELIITATSSPVRSLGGEEVDRVVSVIHDITTTEKLDQLRDEFFAAAAHSLKTPVAVVKAHAQLLAARANTPNERTTAQTIERQCGSMDRLVQNLLVLARVRSGTLQLHPREVDLAAVVAEVAREMGGGSRHELRTSIQATPLVFADSERVRQILRNLVEAAGQATPPGMPITLLLEQRGDVARMGVAALQVEPVAEPAELAMGRAVGERVTVHLAVACEARLVPERSPAGVRTTWVELASMQRETHAGA